MGQHREVRKTGCRLNSILGCLPTRVDWIISKGLLIESGDMEPIGISDHAAYWI
jgi:hypothetical protein